MITALSSSIWIGHPGKIQKFLLSPHLYLPAADTYFGGGEGRELGDVQAEEREQNFLGGTSGETLPEGPYHLLPFALPWQDPGSRAFILQSPGNRRGGQKPHAKDRC